MSNAPAYPLAHDTVAATAGGNFLHALAGALSSIGRYRSLISEVDQLMRASNQELRRLGICRDQITHHAARKYKLIDS